MILETNSPQETFSAGRQLGEKAFPGQVITLTGDLGVGKTVFTQGLAKGLGIEEPVNSPTFTIVQVYDEGRLPLYHFDVYRIGDIEEMDEVGFEEYVMDNQYNYYNPNENSNNEDRQRMNSQSEALSLLSELLFRREYLRRALPHRYG